MKKESIRTLNVIRTWLQLIINTCTDRAVVEGANKLLIEVEDLFEREDIASTLGRKTSTPVSEKVSSNANVPDGGV
jgi:hypothetical protein